MHSETIILNDAIKRSLQNKIVWCFCLTIIPTFWLGCAGVIPQKKHSPEECVERLDESLRAAPIKAYLVTLDNQHVPLQEFFSSCARNYPYCVLYSKFYWWENEIKEIVSKADSGVITHKIRVYYNLLSSCYPERVHPLRTHGDVAEFYDENGQFMGLAVYMGQGYYCPLPYSKYEKKDRLNSLFSLSSVNQRR